MAMDDRERAMKVEMLQSILEKEFGITSRAELVEAIRHTAELRRATASSMKTLSLSSSGVMEPIVESPAAPFRRKLSAGKYLALC